MKKYDFFFILSGNQTETEAAASLENIKQLLRSEGAAEPAFDNLGKHKLAFGIGQDRFGYLINSTVEMPAAGVASLKDKLRQEPKVIRYSLATLKAGQTPGKYTIKSVLTVTERAGERFAARKEKRYQTPTSPAELKPVVLSSEELDKKLDQILTENPTV